MRLPRFSIAGLMILVLVVALNFAVGRFLMRGAMLSALGLMLSGPLLELSLWRLFRCRGRSRAFWAGTLVCGLPIAASFVWWTMHPPGCCMLVRAPNVVPTPDPLVVVLWSSYGGYADDLVYSILEQFHIEPIDSELGVWVVIASLPQLVFALAGGMLARFLISRFGTATPSNSKRADGAQAIAANV